MMGGSRGGWSDILGAVAYLVDFILGRKADGGKGLDRGVVGCSKWRGNNNIQAGEETYTGIGFIVLGIVGFIVQRRCEC